MKRFDPNGKICILEADPTRYGGIQNFVRNLAGYLPQERTFLLAYYRDLAEEKPVPTHLIRLNDNPSKCGKHIYLSGSPLRRNFALLCDLLRIRRNLEKFIKDGDTLVVNSASALLLFCSRKVLCRSRVILVQHTTPRMMYKRAFDFGGLLRFLKIARFKKFVDAAVSFVELDVGFYLMLAYRFEFCKNLCVVLQEVPHSDKCVHYLDADLDGSFTS